MQGLHKSQIETLVPGIRVFSEFLGAASPIDKKYYSTYSSELKFISSPIESFQARLNVKTILVTLQTIASIIKRNMAANTYQIRLKVDKGV